MHSPRHQSLKSITTVYQLLGTAGRGQYGQVHCGRHLQTGDLVALKQLAVERFPTQNLLRELRHLLALDHDNINRCYALEHAREGRFLVLEYCAGGTLRDLLNQGYPLTYGQVIDFGLQLLAGLSHAHAQRLIHCDIKPENILLKPIPSGWQLKLTDFGISRQQQIGMGKGEITTTGSPAYMAPERFYGSATVASDLYSVGIILHELLTGKRPFSGSPAQLMYAHLNQGVNFAPHQEQIPPSLQMVIEKSLRKLPGRRFVSADKMAQSLQSLSGIPLDQTVEGATEREAHQPPLREIRQDIQLHPDAISTPLVNIGDPHLHPDLCLDAGLKVQFTQDLWPRLLVIDPETTQVAESWDLPLTPDLTVAAAQTLLCRERDHHCRWAWIRVRPFQLRWLLFPCPGMQCVGFPSGFAILDSSDCLTLLNTQGEAVTRWQLPPGSQLVGLRIDQCLELNLGGSQGSLDVQGILRAAAEADFI
ncbi:MAG: serine/threonine protein kinase [Synechococcaceae cyanobacterium SM2_3_2]|nr:serine/threonine protein kinase [Synechococcaceae cyanobacterium SM2_3_2]